MSSNPADRFDTASLRAAVLDAWRSSPTRYREDANVEEDYALGGYRDRLFVELVQNAVDAARAAGVPARVHVTVGDDSLVVANTGTPLDRSGVESLASMRASAKRDDAAVGRFGVGFAAVLAVTDEPAITSHEGGVRFSRTDTAALMRDDPALASELDTRSPPVLRLPFPFEGDPAPTSGQPELPPGYDTAVILPWRDAAARERAVEALRGIDDALFIAFPDLVELVVDGAPPDVAAVWSAAADAGLLAVSADGATRRWRLHSTSGEWADSEVVEAPTEQQRRRTWVLTWAMPVTATGGAAGWPAERGAGWPARVLHAPTPTDEVLEFPALLVGDFPVDPTRRRLAPDAMTEAMLRAASGAYAEVVRDAVTRDGSSATALVPGVDLVGPVDGRIRDEVRTLLERTPWVPRAADGSLASPRDLVAVEPASSDLVSTLAPHVTDLLAPDWLPQVATLRGLGLTTRRWSDVWDVVATLPLTAETWHRVYEAALGLDRTSWEGLPVLLADGRVVRDARQCLVPGEVSPHDAQVLGLSLVDETAMHPLLERLGARAFDPRVHLEALPSRVREALRDDETEARLLLASVAAVLAATDVRPGEVAELGETPVPTAAGEWNPAAQVVLPGTPLSRAADQHQLLDSALASEHRDGWLSLGVLGGLTVVHVADQPMDLDRWDQLMVDGGDWCEDTAELLAATSVDDLLVTAAALVRGVELLEQLDTPSALALLGDPQVRAAIVEPAMIVDATGRTRTVPAPAAWWLSESSLIDGRAPIELRLPGDDRIAPFFETAEIPGDPDLMLLQAIGVHTTLESWLSRPGGVAELLTAMARHDVTIPNPVMPAFYSALQRCNVDPDTVETPARLRALAGGSWQLVEAAEVVVAIAPHHAYAMAYENQKPCIPGGHSLAELLDLHETDDRTCGAVPLVGTGDLRSVPAALLASVGEREYREHESIVVGGRELDWWVCDDGEIHACTLDGLAHALAWAGGHWDRRYEFMARLAAEPDLEREQLDAAYD